MSYPLHVWPVTSSVWRNNQVKCKKIASKLNEYYLNWAQDTDMRAEALAQGKRPCDVTAHHVRTDTDPSASRNSSLYWLAFHDNIKTPMLERLLTHKVVTQKMLVFSYVCQSRLFLSVAPPPSLPWVSRTTGCSCIITQWRTWYAHFLGF